MEIAQSSENWSGPFIIYTSTWESGVHRSQQHSPPAWVPKDLEPLQSSSLETIKKISPSRELHYDIPPIPVHCSVMSPEKKELQALVLNFEALLSHILWTTSTKLQKKNFHSANYNFFYDRLSCCAIIWTTTVQYDGRLMLKQDSFIRSMKSHLKCEFYKMFLLFTKRIESLGHMRNLC